MRCDALSVLCLCFATFSVAHADSIDYFTLIGQGHTISFSLPATNVIQEAPSPFVTVLRESFSETIDGVSGYNGGAEFYLAPTFLLPSWILSVPVNNQQLVLYGPMLQSLIFLPISNPAPNLPPFDIQATFVPGIYAFQLITQSPPGALYTYTLTITPESVGTTPEPSSLALLATGSFSLLAAIRTRARIISR